MRACYSFATSSPKDAEAMDTFPRHAALRWPLLLLALLPLLAVAGKRDDPWAEINVDDAADADEADLFMVAIDGSMDVESQSTYTLVPGAHGFKVASTRKGPGGEMTYRTMGLELKPCVRYALIARHGPADNPGARWQVAVKSETPIRKCVERFGTQLAANATPAPAEASP